jgi:ElaB/YqjD/DUF883 family membrane-anchored ribosome-binding protein
MTEHADTQPSGDAPAGEPQSPEEIRAEIERTREQLGDTVEALAEKTDVKAQVAKRIDAAKDRVQDAKDDVVAKAKHVTPDSAGAGAHQVADTVQGKPIPFAAAGAFAAGVGVGWLLGRR